jgi:hypothetical protein
LGPEALALFQQHKFLVLIQCLALLLQLAVVAVAILLVILERRVDQVVVVLILPLAARQTPFKVLQELAELLVQVVVVVVLAQ